ncbi:MAG: ATP-binding protein [Promethearchaeota archaeon]
MKISIKKIKSFIVRNSSFISVLLILTFSSYLWMTDLQGSKKDLDLRSQTLSNELIISLQNAVDHRIDALFNLGDVWIKTNETSDLYNHSRYLEYIPPVFQLEGGFLAINWISTDSIISWVYPEEQNKAALGKNVSILADGVYNYALNNSIHSLTFDRTPLINLFQDKYGFATYFPLVYNGNLTGLLNGVFALNTLFDTLLNGSHMVAKLSEYSVNIAQNDSYVYSYGENFTTEDSFVVYEELDLLGIKLNIFIRPNGNLRNSVSAINNSSIILLGLTLSILVGILAYSLQKQYQLVQKTVKEKRIIEEALFVKQKMESLGTLAGGISHDFNNILAGIRGNVELLLINLQEVKSQEYSSKTDFLLKDCFENLDEIQKLIDRSIKLNRQITEFSKNPTYNFDLLNVNEVIENSLKSFSKMIDQRITIEKTLNKTTLFILGDKGRFSQMLLNLLINARDAILAKDFSKSSKTQIMISTRVVSKKLSLGIKKEFTSQFEKKHIKFDSEKNLEICVQDTGIGIPSETIDKIFDPFFTTKDKSRGTGLGLTIVYNVVTFMGGSIKVESKENEGTKFIIVFPLVLNISIDFHDVRDKNESLTQVSYQNLDGMNILFIEDEQLIYESILKYLKKSGAKVFSNENGTEGYKTFKKNYRKLDLVILDINLPGLNGVELYHKIKEIVPNIPILFITGYSEYSIPTPDKFDLGVLIKPFSLNDLAQKINQLRLLKKKIS